MGIYFVKKNKFKKFNLYESTEIIIDELNKSLNFKDKLVVGLAGGSSLNKFYKILAKKWNINLSKINFFLIDERSTKNLNLRNEESLNKIFFGNISRNYNDEIKIYY